MKIDKVRIYEIYQEIIPLRRQLHQNPEPSGEEFETKARIDGYLAKYNIQTLAHNLPTATIGQINGGKKGKTLAIRADIDALPIEELTPLPYKSTNGYMHACGHDIHTAILLATARYLKENEDQLQGQVRLLFQHDEEKTGGAEDMIHRGAMEGVDYVIGLHVNPSYASGSLGLKSGFLNASLDDFTLRVKGRGGHGAHPHLSQDTILASAHIICALQSLVSRRISPFDPSVISIGSIHGGNRENILPSEVELKGTLRASNENTRQDLLKEIAHISSSIAQSMHMESQMEIRPGYISLVNTPAICQRLWQAWEKDIDPSKLSWLPTASMGADDFAYFLKEAPGCYYSLGVGKDMEENPPLHSPYFSPDEEAIYYGILSQVSAARELLQGP